MIQYDGPCLLAQYRMLELIKAWYREKNYVWPDAQDAASFCSQEAMELLDCFLRDKPYKRNHEKSQDGKGKEAAQCLLMLLVTCDIAGIDLELEFIKLVEGRS